MTRFALNDKPIIGCHVKLSPIRYLTKDIIKEDTKHPYYDKNVTGVVVNYKKYNSKINLVNLVAIKTHNEKIMLIPPDFLITYNNIKEKKERRISSQIKTLLNNVSNRILELNLVKKGKAV